MAGACCGSSPLGAEENAVPLSQDVLAHSLVSLGDTARLQHALAKARRGDSPLTVAVIGGSITGGAKASTREKNYGSLVAKWWRETFPKAAGARSAPGKSSVLGQGAAYRVPLRGTALKVEFVNAGIGATGSNYGALRAQRDLLSHHPDFVVVEYGVNDGNTQACAETYEGLVRQTLNQPNQPAVMLLFMMHNNGGNAQEWQSKVGAHYGLPMVSFRDALWPEIQAGRMKWEDVEADMVHPNDRGHAYAAQFVTEVLQRLLKDLPADDALPAVKPVPAPLFTDLFEHVSLLEANALKPVTNEGWSYDAKDRCWKSSQPGSVVEFEVEGRVIFFMEWHIRGPMGKAKVQVDDRPPVTIDAWFDQTWGGFRRTSELARDLKPGAHRVRVELLEEKNPASDGHEFRILGLGAAGVSTSAAGGK